MFNNFLFLGFFGPQGNFLPFWAHFWAQLGQNGPKLFFSWFWGQMISNEGSHAYVWTTCQKRVFLVPKWPFWAQNLDLGIFRQKSDCVTFLPLLAPKGRVIFYGVGWGGGECVGVRKILPLFCWGMKHFASILLGYEKF